MEEFEVVIMIEVVTEEMHGSDRDSDLKLITSEPWLDTALSTRAKWRALWRARVRMLRNVLYTADIVRDAC